MHVPTVHCFHNSARTQIAACSYILILNSSNLFKTNLYLRTNSAVLYCKNVNTIIFYRCSNGKSKSILGIRNTTVDVSQSLKDIYQQYTFSVWASLDNTTSSKVEIDIIPYEYSKSHLKILRN